MSLIALNEGKTFLTVLNIATASLLLSLVFYMRIRRTYNTSITICIVIMFFFYLFFFVTGGSNNTGHLWAYTFPLFASFLLGSKKGGIYSLLFLIITLIYCYSGLKKYYLTDYADEFKIRFFLSFFTVTIFTYYFEKIREKTDTKLYKKNNELNNVVEELKRSEIELKYSNHEAEKANKAKSEFLRNMSHELRTPLNHILGFSKLVKDEKVGSLNPIQSEYLDDVLQSGNHLLLLINDLLDLNRVEAGFEKLEKTYINFTEIARKVAGMFTLKLKEKNISLIMEISEINTQLYADRRRIVQIFYNLLSNAVKFTNSGGSITIKVEEDIDVNNILISISDTGIGIEKNNLNYIFNSFSRIENSFEKKIEGTGLGLALTKNLVELHGGIIRAESLGIGKGSMFKFTLPLQHPE